MTLEHEPDRTDISWIDGSEYTYRGYNREIYRHKELDRLVIRGYAEPYWPNPGLALVYYPVE